MHIGVTNNSNWSTAQKDSVLDYFIDLLSICANLREI